MSEKHQAYIQQQNVYKIFLEAKRGVRVNPLEPPPAYGPAYGDDNSSPPEETMILVWASIGNDTFHIDMRL